MARTRKGELLPRHPIAFLPGVAPRNESRPQVNTPLGRQSIPVTCNTNTQNPLSYKINVLLVHPVLPWPNPIDSTTKSSAAHVWQIMVKWSDGRGYTWLPQLSWLYDFGVIAWYKMRKRWIVKKRRQKRYRQSHQSRLEIPLGSFNRQTDSLLVFTAGRKVDRKCLTLGPNFIPYILNHECSFFFFFFHA